ncbi:MAG: DUF2171 domain-containing protein [Gemmataceae bacterium]
MAGIGDIREHMAVYGSCGDRVGTVDGVRGEWLCLTRDPGSGDQPHCVPLDWVDSVGRHVRLSRPCDEVLRRWQPLAAAGW